jgi:hypothetical protein
MRTFSQFLESQGFQADACEDLEHPDFYRLAERLYLTLERISLMACRCVDDGTPCSGCTKTGREAPRVAWAAIKPIHPEIP